MNGLIDEFGCLNYLCKANKVCYERFFLVLCVFEGAF